MAPKVVLWSVLAVVLAVVNLQIADKEKTLSAGETVLLRLAPVDPRSLLQGDYMALRYAIAGEVFGLASQQPVGGRMVVTLDENRVAAYARLDDNTGLASDEKLLVYRLRGENLRIASDAYFFQEGTGETYARAAYGELKVDNDGDAVLIGLRDAEFNRLGD